MNWTKETILEAQKVREMPEAIRRQIALSIDVDLYLRQCRCHERLHCPARENMKRAA